MLQYHEFPFEILCIRLFYSSLSIFGMLNGIQFQLHRSAALHFYVQYDV